ncbi:hypothetical protein ABEY59_25645 [Bacillus albus]|uniref:hypothetical protein n=1 Tax=Bacillus albus TaxID=2026189 RepID=UPI003D1F75E8
MSLSIQDELQTCTEELQRYVTPISLFMNVILKEVADLIVNTSRVAIYPYDKML